MRLHITEAQWFLTCVRESEFGSTKVLLKTKKYSKGEARLWTIKSLPKPWVPNILMLPLNCLQISVFTIALKPTN